MSTPNVNYSNLDGRYAKPTDVAAAINTQAAADAGKYVSFGPTAPNYAITPIWVDTSLLPQIVKGWDGSSWVNLLGSSSPSLSSTAVPTISGTAQTGSTLTASNGSWSATPDSYNYQWSRAGTSISGATTQSYVVVSGDVGQSVTVTVTAVKAGYILASATSLGVTPVTATSNVTYTDNGDGTITYFGSGVTDNGDGTFTLTGSNVNDNGDGTFAVTV